MTERLSALASLAGIPAPQLDWLAVIEVVDDGPGIEEKDLGRVFDPFYTTKDVGQGAGLGLDVVQAVIRNHRGSVDVISQPGRTEFRVVLPVWDKGGKTRAE